jgi:hypothetical protein
MFDLAQMSSDRSEQGAVLTLRHPVTNENLEGWNITLVGKDSATFQRVNQKFVDKQLADASSNRGKPKVKSADLQRQNIDTLVACTKGWEGLILNGQPFAFSDENARKLYTENAWIKEQAESFIEDRANFLGNS